MEHTGAESNVVKPLVIYCHYSEDFHRFTDGDYDEYVSFSTYGAFGLSNDN